MGIKVDKVVQGKGTSNTGNIGRHFFEHAQEVSEITGLNKILIEHFKVILSISACSYNVNSEKYDNYAKDTLKLYLQLYYMCSLLFSWSAIFGFSFFQLLNPCFGFLIADDVIVLFAKSIHGKQYADLVLLL